MEYKEHLEQLRQQIPIGIHHGLNLLQQTKGDINQARELFETEMIQVIVSKTTVSRCEAKEHLVACQYELACTLSRIEEEQFSLSELILGKCKNSKEEALALIVRQVEIKENIQREYWLPLEELGHLPPPVYGLLVVHEFLSYEDWEGFSSAIYFHPDIVAAQLETIFNLAEMAKCLQSAKQRSEVIYGQFIGKDPSLIANVMNKDNEFCRQEEFFNQNRLLVIDRLYNLVVEYVALFP